MKRILTLVLAWVICASTFPIVGAVLEPVTIAYEDFDYGVAEGTDISTIQATKEADPTRGFSGQYKRNAYSDELVSGSFFMHEDGEMGHYAKAIKGNPYRIFRNLATPMEMEPSETRVYYVTWNQFLGENDILTGAISGTNGLETVNQGQIIDFATVPAETKVFGGGFIRTSEGKNLPFLNWGAVAKQIGTRELIQGVWYRMVLRLEANSGANDRMQLKAYPFEEYPHLDWDVAIEFSNAVDIVQYGFTLSTTNGEADKRLNDVKLEMYTNYDELQGAEEAKNAYYEAVLGNAENKEELLLMAEQAIDAVGGNAKLLLQEEMAGIAEYLDFFQALAQVRADGSPEAYDLAQSILDGKPAGLRKQEMQKMLLSSGDYVMVVSKVQEAEENLTTEAIEAAQALVDAMADGEDKQKLNQRLNKARVLQAEQALELAEISLEESDIEAALALIEALPEGNDKDRLNQGIIDIYATLVVQLVVHIEAMTPTEQNAGQITEKLAEATAEIEERISDPEEQSALLARLEAVYNSLAPFKIAADRWREDFDYTQGGQLSDLWKGDENLTEEIDSDFVIIEPGVLGITGEGKIYREINGIDTEQDKEYYISFQFSANNLQGFSGLKLGNGYFGVEPMGDGMVPVLNFGNEVKGTDVLDKDKTYTASLRVVQGEVLFSINPMDGEAGASIKGEISGEMLEKEQTWTDEFDTQDTTKAANALASNNVHEVAASTAYYGDSGRLTRKAKTSEGWVTYEVTDCKKIRVRGIMDGKDTEDFKFHISNDQASWEPITPTIETLIPEGWQGYDYIITEIQGGVAYLKITLPYLPSGEAYSKQLNFVELVKNVNYTPDNVNTNVLGIHANTKTDGSFKLSNIVIEEVEAAFLGNINELLQEMMASGNLKDIENAQAVCETLPNSIVKDMYQNQIGVYLEQNKSKAPNIYYVSISGNNTAGSALTAVIDSIDTAGNGAAPTIKWSVGSTVISNDTSIVVASSHSGKVIKLEVTSNNQFGVSGNTKSATINIVRETTAQQTYSGGGGGGGLSSPPSSVVLPTPQSTPITFSDISGHWASMEILDMAEKGIVMGMGDNTFMPNSPVTRGQFAMLLYRILGLYDSGVTDLFQDVKEGAWYAVGVNAIAGKKIMVGLGNGEFGAERLITREEMAKAVIVALEKSGKILDWKEVPEFSDKDQISPWALDYIGKCVELGLMVGKDDNCFDPRARTNRAEAAVVLYRCMQNL